jgi:hypothetical protein
MENKKSRYDLLNGNSNRSSRYFDFFQKYFMENTENFSNGNSNSNNSKANSSKTKNSQSNDKNKINNEINNFYWFERLLNKINEENNFLKYRVSLLFFVLQSNESKILIKEFSKTDFFVWFFPLLEKCKTHYQTKEYHPEGTLYDHLILTAIEINSNDFALKLAAILHDIGKVESINYNPKENYPKYPNHANLSASIAKRYIKDILRFFPFYPFLLEKISFLIENHMKIAFLPDIEEDKKKDILSSMYLPDLLKLLKADLNASSADLNIYKRVYSYIQKLKIQLQ